MNKYLLILLLGLIGLSSCQKEQQDDLMAGNLSIYGFKSDNAKCGPYGNIYTLEIYEETHTVTTIIMEEELPNSINIDYDNPSVDVRLKYNMIVPATTKEDYAQIELLKIEEAIY